MISAIIIAALVAMTVIMTTSVAIQVDAANATIVPTFKVGLLFSETGKFSETGNRTKKMLGIWQDLVNARSDYEFKIEVIPANIRSDIVYIKPQFDYLMSQNVSFFVGAEGELSVVASQYANQVKIPIISRVALTSDYKCSTPPYPANSNCRRLNDRAFNHAYSTLQPAGYQFKDYFGMLGVKKAKTVAIVYWDDNFHTETCMGGKYYAANNKIDVIYTRKISTSYTNDEILEIVGTLKTLDPDAITWCRRLGCVEDIHAFEKLDYLPRSLMMVQCTDTDKAINTVKTDFRYVNGVKFWDVTLNGEDYSDIPSNVYASHFPATTNTTSARAFSNLVIAKTGIPPTFTDASTMALGYMIEATLSTTPDFERASIASQIARVSTKSFFGTISSDLIGMNSQNSVIVTQVDSSKTLCLVSPTSVATVELVYPIPSWSERTYNFKYAGSAGAKVVIAVMCICVFIYLICIILIAMHRNDPLIKALNIPMVMISFIGAIVMSFATLTWLDENTDTTCRARIPMFIVGLSFLFVPPIIISLLLNKIFHNASMRVVKMSKFKLAAYFLGMSAPLWITGFVLSGVYRMETYIQEFDPLRPVQNMTICVVDEQQVPEAMKCAIVLIVSFFIMLLSWWTLALRNRDVDHALFAQTAKIMMSAILMIFLLGVTMAIEFALVNSSKSIMEVKQVIRGVCIQISVLISMGVLYGGRFVQTIKQNGFWGVYSIKSGHGNYGVGGANVTVLESSHHHHNNTAEDGHNNTPVVTNIKPNMSPSVTAIGPKKVAIAASTTPPSRNVKGPSGPPTPSRMMMLMNNSNNNNNTSTAVIKRVETSAILMNASVVDATTGHSTPINASPSPQSRAIVINTPDDSDVV